MVFFSCSSCGESLKKNQVNKHYVRCRMGMVSCLDCNKEFWGDDFNTHIKCITEEEKYSGKDFKARPAQNKGEVKQDAWLQKVQSAIDNSNSKPNIRNLLERLKDYPNIPRKQAKFENFVHNSLRIRDKSLVKEIWNILMTENTLESMDVDGSKDETNLTNDEENSTEKSVDGEIDENKTKKESKRDKKAKRSEKQNKREKKDCRKMVDVNNDSDGMECDEDEKMVCEDKKMKKKKRKYEGMETVEHSQKKKSLKEKEREEEDEVGEENDENEEEGINEKEKELEEEEEEEEEDEDDEESRKSKRKIKFDWGKTIISILKNEEDQRMSMKKVGKKVIAEYLAQGGYAESNDKLRATFTKKVTKNPRFVCVKDEVRLSREK